MKDQFSNQHTETDLQQLRTWLRGEVRMTRAIPVTCGMLLLVVAGVALD